MNRPINITAGNIIPVKSPVFRLIESDTIPVSHGPAAHPKSPPSASNANIAVPPDGYPPAVRLNIPGHMRLTVNPQREQPSRDIAGTGANAVTANDRIQKTEHTVNIF